MKTTKKWRRHKIEDGLKNAPPGIQLYLNSWKLVHLDKCYSDFHSLKLTNLLIKYMHTPLLLIFLWQGNKASSLTYTDINNTQSTSVNVYVCADSNTWRDLRGTNMVLRTHIRRNGSGINIHSNELTEVGHTNRLIWKSLFARYQKRRTCLLDPLRQIKTRHTSWAEKTQTCSQSHKHPPPVVFARE